MPLTGVQRGGIAAAPAIHGDVDRPREISLDAAQMSSPSELHVLESGGMEVPEQPSEDEREGGGAHENRRICAEKRR